MNEYGVVGMFCGIAVAINLSIASYFILGKRDDKRALVLGLIFLLIAIKLSKSVWFFIFQSTGVLGPILSYAGLITIGPLIHLYIQRSFDVKYEFKLIDLSHLIIPFIGTTFFIIFDYKFSQFLYIGAIVLFFIYLIIAWKIHSERQYEVQNIKTWNQSLLIVLSIIMCTIVFQHSVHSKINYAIGAIISAIPVYYLLFKLIKNPLSLTPVNAPNISSDGLSLIKEAIESDKIYLERDCTLSSFSRQTKLPTYLISKAVQKLYSRSFPETINHFRVEHIKKELINNSGFYKIEAIAYDAGFKTPSAFYRAFSKETGLSPKKYRKLKGNSNDFQEAN